MKDVATFVAGEGLRGVETATTLRKRGGRVETMDGPFAETRELFGGFYLIDAPDLDAALRHAAEIPAARYGSVKVRPVMDYCWPGPRSKPCCGRIGGRLLAADPDPRAIPDDRLRLIFTCCHPALEEKTRVALTVARSAG